MMTLFVLCLVFFQVFFLVCKFAELTAIAAWTWPWVLSPLLFMVAYKLLHRALVAIVSNRLAAERRKRGMRD